MARAERFDLIVPEWPAPPNVRAAATTRSGGESGGAYATLNLGTHVGDAPAIVARNRRRLRAELSLPAEPMWLEQVHGTRVHAPDEALVADVRAGAASPPTADASLGSARGQICAVMTADCLPVLFCNRQGTRVAAAHAGWRGLAGGVLEATVHALAAAGAPAESLLAWFGPAIAPADYEVGAEVRDALADIETAFRPTRPGHWQLDLYGAARARLARAGVTAVWGGNWSTAGEPDRFFSHRRDGVTGRQATLIWLT